MCLASSCCHRGVVAGCLNTESLDYLERGKRAASQMGPGPEPLQERAEQGQARQIPPRCPRGGLGTVSAGPCELSEARP